MTDITDDVMRAALTKTKAYCLVILKSGPAYGQPGAQKIVWEHARRNFALRADGKLSIVCPMTDDGDVRGIGIFNTDAAEAKQIMDDDPGVKAGLFTYTVHPCRSFPGDALAS